MESYKLDEIDITQWKPKRNDNKILIAMTKLDNNIWKGELYKTYGLYYRAYVKDKKIKDILNLGWELQQK